MSAEYWKNENPTEICTKHHVFRWYQQAKRLQISYSSYTDKDGNKKYGRTIGVNLRDLENNDPLKAFLKIALEI